MVRKKGIGGEPSDARRAVVLMEKLEPQVQLILEGQTGVTEQLGRLEKRTEEGYSELHKFIMDGFKELNGQLTTTNKHLTELVDRFNVHERTHAA